MNATRRPEIVLASTSPYRKALVERLGLPFRCAPPPFDEASASAEGLAPRDLAAMLAVGKAESVSELEPEAVVVGCDQLVHLDGRIFGKPGAVSRAVDQLEAMSGRTHELITAMVVIHEGARFMHVDVTRLTMRRLDRRSLRRYVEGDRPLDCAGSYKIEERGVVLFDRIETEDFTAITGLPLLALTRILGELGFETP
jgi:septum formation protein